jgi:hypothetical protein
MHLDRVELTPKGRAYMSVIIFVIQTKASHRRKYGSVKSAN